MIVFSASLHYSNDLAATLQGAARVLCLNGKIIIVAAPVFKLPASGVVLVVERVRKFQELFGIAPASCGKGSLTELEIKETAQTAQLSVNFSYSDDHWLKSPRRIWIQRKIGREPARFPMIVLQKFADGTQE